MDTSLKEEIEKRARLAKDISKKSAGIAMDFFGRARQWDKKDSSPVTEADIAIDRQLQKDIAAVFNSDAILSEEGVDNTSRLNKDFCWIIDPIDGTKEFIAQRHDFCVMIGICYKGVPVYGVINIPATGEIFSGGEGFGVALEMEDNAVRLPEKGLDGNKVLISRSHRSTLVTPYIEENSLTPVPCGSSGVKACRLIDGSAQHYIHGTTIHEWDAAAADAIVRGAGGWFRAMNSDEFFYNKPAPTIDGIIASFCYERVKDISSFFADRLTFT